ncbi:MAG: hypothetical protein SynsKO_41300 [Synoicihabitans sp.]
MTLATLCHADGLRYGMTVDEVRTAAGAPTSSLDRGDRAIWIYPDGGRVDFQDGRVVEIKNMLMASEAEVLAAEAAAEEAARLAAEAEQREADAAAAKLQEEQAALEAEWAAEQAEALEAMSDSIEQFEAQYGEGGVPDMGLGPPPASEFWIILGVQSLLGVLITMIVLKLAFKWADLHADWGQMFLPALVDMFAGTLIRAGAYAVWKTDQLFRIDDGVSFFALLVVLKFATHASSWQRAVTVAVAAKLANLVVWTLLSVVILQALFG